MIDNWKDMKVGQFKRLLDIDSESEDSVFEMVSVLCGETLDQTLNRPIADVRRDVEKLSFLETQPKIVRAHGKYKLGDTTYVFTSDPGEITLAQYIDFSNEKKDASHITEMLSIVLVPEGHEYGQGYSFDKVRQDIDTYLGYEDANAISAFFFGLWILCLKRAVRVTRKALKKAVKEGAVTKEQAEETLREMQEVLRLTTGSTA